MSLKADLLQDTRIRALQGQYEAKGLPFGYTLDYAIYEASGGQDNPVLAGIIHTVIRILESELDRLAQQEGTTKAGKFWRLLKKGQWGDAFTVLFAKK